MTTESSPVKRENWGKMKHEKLANGLQSRRTDRSRNTLKLLDQSKALVSGWKAQGLWDGKLRGKSDRMFTRGGYAVKSRLKGGGLCLKRLEKSEAKYGIIMEQTGRAESRGVTMSTKVWGILAQRGI